MMTQDKQEKRYSWLQIAVLMGLFFSCISITTTPIVVHANEEKIEQLQDDISKLNSKLDDINQAIKEAESRVAESSAEAQSIAQKVKTLEASRAKIEKDISYTETEIKRRQLEIQKLGYEISDKEKGIGETKQLLRTVVQELHATESVSFLEALLQYNSVGDFWNHVVTVQQVQEAMYDHLLSLQDLKQSLHSKQTAEAENKKKLESNKALLKGEQESVASTKQKQQELLTVAQKSEAEQRAYLAEKQKEKQQFESALLEFESQLKTLVDPTSFPSSKRGILGWPLDTIRITQQFGGTEFAKNNPQLYARPFHNGVDFGIPLGTPVYAVLDGVVQGTGNTDAFPNCRSWGQWILIKHNNGLTSLYGHLSSIIVKEGETVTKGQTIGLSGSTGISTGPHLHLTLYASQGVQIIQYNQFKPGSTGCAATAARIPVAPLDAYLDPMAYLPEL